MDGPTVKVVFVVLIAFLGSFALKRIVAMAKAGRQAAPRASRKFATRRALYGKTEIQAPAGRLREGSIEPAAYDALRQSRNTTHAAVRTCLFGSTAPEAVPMEPLTAFRRVPLRWREVSSGRDEVQRWELRPDHGGALLGMAEFHWVGELEQALGVAIGRTARAHLAEWRPRGRTLFAGGSRTEFVHAAGEGLPDVSVEVAGDLHELATVRIGKDGTYAVDKEPVARPLMSPLGEPVLSRTSLRFEIASDAPEKSLDLLVLAAHFTTMRYGKL
ncbi:MAG: hypothetical protein H6745_17315 [Deltaproteobacteria bacterium]|nr:hypothetical protein [Deltaproteobacteria bacterium]